MRPKGNPARKCGEEVIFGKAAHTYIGIDVFGAVGVALRLLSAA